MSHTSPFRTKRIHNQIILEQTRPIHFTHKPHYRLFVYARAGLRIATASIANEQPLKGNEEEIIRQIHTIRYNSDNPYVITGGHFPQIFVRNLGIFFNALLDPRIPSTDEDWYLRQAIALKTVEHDLEIFRLANREYTTITQVNKSLYTGLDLYARPSDSLYAIMYTLTALTDDTFIKSRFPTIRISKAEHPLQTKKAGMKLLTTYTPLLKQLLNTYYQELLDTKTNLIKKPLLLASARDGIKRQSSFYDNVILWSTLQLSAKFRLYDISEKALQIWKVQIIKAFWDEKIGIFLDDLSLLSHKAKLFSADSFIVTSTGFLDIKKVTERKMLLQMIQYVKKHQLDKPFPLHYSSIDLSKNLYWPVRYFAPSYMGTSIWSHWGMEYIKALLSLAKDSPELLTDAKKHLSAYKNTIEKYGGYPEVYNNNGEILSTRLYRSVLHNGWIINYEQTKMLYKNLVK
jgi:hypothetical protein